MHTKTLHILGIVAAILIVVSLFLFTKKIEAPVSTDDSATASSTLESEIILPESEVSDNSGNSTSTNNTTPSTETKAGENKLAGTEWVWVKTNLGTGSTVNAPAGGKFVLGFTANKEVRSSTDCNGLGGNYVIDGEVLSFTPFISTLMYCEGSLEQQYSSQLQLTNSYTIKGNELHLNLNRDFGTMIFTRK